VHGSALREIGELDDQLAVASLPGAEGRSIPVLVIDHEEVGTGPVELKSWKPE